jgi:hypothetical protein
MTLAWLTTVRQRVQERAAASIEMVGPGNSIRSGRTNGEVDPRDDDGVDLDDGPTERGPDAQAPRWHL